MLSDYDMANRQNKIAKVLILVVMEDALWLATRKCYEDYRFCLNPCCNGRCSLTLIVFGGWTQQEIVLILVVMEDALWRFWWMVWGNIQKVLILVVMEDALWQLISVGMKMDRNVLILVVMEDALWQSTTAGGCSHGVVLILVVMEDALWLLFFGRRRENVESLNPCCNGRCSLTIANLKGEAYCNAS